MHARIYWGTEDSKLDLNLQCFFFECTSSEGSDGSSEPLLLAYAKSTRIVHYALALMFIFDFEKDHGSCVCTGKQLYYDSCVGKN